MINKEELKRLNEIKNILIKAKLTEGVTPLKIKSLIEELGPTKPIPERSPLYSRKILLPRQKAAAQKEQPHCKIPANSGKYS